MNFNENLLEKFKDGALNYKSEKELCAALGLTRDFEKKALKEGLKALEGQGEILLNKNKKYVSVEAVGAKRGVLSGNERGFAFFVPDDKSGDLFIPHSSLNGAMHGDCVLCVKVTGKRGSNDEGEVAAVLKRGYDSVVGTYDSRARFGFVQPDDRRFDGDVFVTGKNSLKAKDGDKVVVKITKYPSRGKSAEGRIEEILGREGDDGMEELSIIKSYSLPTEFPDRVLDEAGRRAVPLVEKDYRGRKDFRMLKTITIDGEDARDLDDAISIERTKKGYKLYVHIADVSEYVRAGSALDREALSRGTSVYFPDRVLPMLPKELSNGMCSLNQGEDRLTLTCVMEIDVKGEVKDSQIVRGVINSDRRMTYTAVSAMLEGDEKTLDEYSDIALMTELMKELALILIEKRKKRGTLDLDVKEAKITVDEKGAIEISEYKRTLAHRIIEEFMIAANETVAEFMFNTELPFVYRIHEKPSPEKLENFTAFVRELGVNMRIKEDDVKPKDFQKVLDRFEGTPLFNMVNRVMLRSMQKARYYPVNLGHFGLASKYYCHFTSPIRRYPDLIIHRIIKMTLEGKALETMEKFKDYVYEAAQISSDREKRADMAERDMDDLFKVRYMSGHIGEEFDAVVSGVTNFGVFAELANTCEGLIKIDTLPKDDYSYDETKFTLKGKKLCFKLGDKIRIKVVGADLENRKVEIILADENPS